MKLNIGKILLTAVAIEVLAILFLFVLVALSGPPDADAAQAYAERVGYWFGPIAGFILCVVGGWQVSRKLTGRHVLNGLVLGLVVALIDGGLLIASGSEFRMIFVLSNLGRIAAGTIGGWLAGKSVGTA